MSVYYKTLSEFHRLGAHLAPPDRSRRRFLDVADDNAARNEQAVPSPRTNAAMRAYFDAREAGDAQSALDAVKDAALSWRADNSAGGVPVFGHLSGTLAVNANTGRMRSLNSRQSSTKRVRALPTRTSRTWCVP
jgi:hypothetical protein